MEKVLVVWTEDQNSHNILLKPTSEQSPNSLQSMKAERVRKLQKKSLKLTEVGS